MLSNDCIFRNKEIPACNTRKDLRNCDSIICCSICPRKEYCLHVCGVLLFDRQNIIEDIIEELKIIEIELFSFCNRRCQWCPNGKLIDRHSNNSYLDIDILKSFLQKLKDYNYSGVFSFSRYNEPFSNFSYFQEILKLIKEYFPYNKLVSNTNGDYLNSQIVQDTLIDELTIMDYDCHGKDWCYNKLLSYKIDNIIEYDSYFLGEINNKKIVYYWNWPENGVISDRGGNLSDYSTEKRDYPCFEPFRFLGLNYDGTLSPCCNIRNDCDKQKNFILGDLNNNTLEEILLSENFKNFKMKIITGNYDETMPCFYCNNTGGRYSKSNGGILYE